MEANVLFTCNVEATVGNDKYYDPDEAVYPDEAVFYDDYTYVFYGYRGKISSQVFFWRWHEGEVQYTTKPLFSTWSRAAEHIQAAYSKYIARLIIS